MRPNFFIFLFITLMRCELVIGGGNWVQWCDKDKPIKNRISETAWDFPDNHYGVLHVAHGDTCVSACADKCLKEWEGCKSYDYSTKGDESEAEECSCWGYTRHDALRPSIGFAHINCWPR
jgi:hypothetical protein